MCLGITSFAFDANSAASANRITDSNPVRLIFSSASSAGDQPDHAGGEPSQKQAGARRMPHPFQRIVAEFIRALLQTGPSSLETPRCGQIWGAITSQRPQVTEDMDILGNDYPEKILETHESPCLSLYQSTHRQFPQRKQDPIRFRNLIRTLEESLRQKYPDREIAPLLAPFNALADDVDFWNHNFEGLAVLGAAGLFRVYRLQRPVADLAIVADSFHTKPLMRIVQSADRYQVLGLNRHSARLFEGNRDSIDEITLAPEVPRSLDEVVEREQERDRASRTHGRVEPGAMGRHGASDSKRDAIDAETERFFRAVDRAVLEHHSRPGGLPLLLAALPEHHHLFRKISDNPQLMEPGIDVDAGVLSLDELRERAWAVVQPRYLDRLEKLIDAFAAAQARQNGSADLSDVARAAAEGRVATLLLEAGRSIPGRIDAGTGAFSNAELDDPRIDDALDDLGEQVLRGGGEVVIVPSERMPTRSGLAATYRF